MAPQLLGFTASAGLLALAVIVLRRGTRPLRLPVALLALDMFAWNFAMLARGLSGHEHWRFIDNAFSPLTPPLALHIVLLFVGRLRRWRWALYLAYGGAGALSLVSLGALFSVAAGTWVASAQQSIACLALLLPEAVLMGALLVRHLRQQRREEARMRARLLLAALLLGGIFGSTEFWDELFPVPALGQFGALAMAFLVSLVVLRLGAPAREHATRTAGYALGLALLGLTAYLAVARWASTNLAAALVAGSTVTAALALAVAEVSRTVLRERRRVRRLGLLGELSTQLAHDLKNPLGALYGAVQVIEEECRRDGTLARTRQFFALIGEQVERIDAAIERYRRFSDELRLEQTDLAALLRRVLDLDVTEEAQRRGIALALDLDLDLDTPQQLNADPLQLGRALQDALRNALEAMPDGGTLRVALRDGALDVGTPAVVLEIADSGVGMDARQCARALEGLHADNAVHGLGLSFTRRVVEAHGGELRLESQRGQGTQVALIMPLPRPS